MHKKLRILTLSAFMLGSIAASAGSPLWLRNPAISPDGTRIAFTYMGDIFTVPVSGGKATRLTSQPALETAPRWSPDSRWIGYSDNRNGNSDIYIISADGGTPRRLTTNSADETPEAFSPDGKWLYFSASIQDPASSALFPSRRMTELYRVATDGLSQPQQVLGTPAELISFIPHRGDGSFLYHDQKGMESTWRKHHTSSITRDIWMYDATSGKHTNLTDRPGEDRNPVVSADGATVSFLSELPGESMNIFSFPLADPKAVTRLTSHSDHPVRSLSQAADGTYAYSYDGELYTLIPGAQPRKVNVTIAVDTAQSPEVVSLGSHNSEATPSPDGQQIAVVNRGDIFVTSVEYPSVKQVTSTAAAEKHVSWHPKGRSLVYTSERDGHWNIYRASIARKDDPNFSNATVINEEAIFNGADGIERTVPRYSPDGEKLAFIQDREKLMVMDVASGKVTQLTDGSAWTSRSGAFNYSWSPDSRYIVTEVVPKKHDPYYDIAIVDVSTGEMIPVTSSGYFDMEPAWALDGNAIIFRSDRLGMRNHASWGSLEDVFMAFLNRDAYDRFRLSEEDYALLKEVEKQQKKDADKNKKETPAKNKKKDKKKKEEPAEEKASDAIAIDRDGLMERLVRLTPNSSDLSAAAISGDGETLYYLSKFDKGYDLWKKDLRKGDVSMVKKLGSKPAGFESDAKGKNIFIISSSGLRKLDTKTDKISSISLSGRQVIDPRAEREAMFQTVVTQEREMFYDTAMHGVDWTSLTDHYRRFLPHINNNWDFAEMLSELLGELNVSHTGSGYSPAGTPSQDQTASLGLLYDLTHQPDALKVAEVVAGGPFDRASSAICPGSVITAVNGTPITPSTDFSELLKGITKKKTLVSFRTPDGKNHDEVVLPVTSGAFNSLLYNRWVKSREEAVDSLSGGRLGYVHIRSMGDDSFRKVYANVLGKYNDREGIVIDVRWNGGGRLHEDIEVLFSGKKYLTQEIRGKETCDMPSRRWNKPSIMLVCEACYSNAHGTPWVYKHQGIGSLVGMPIPGTMTSVNWVTLQNPDLVFGIPVIGYRTAEGTYLENTQLEPDIMVANDPAEIVNGRDAQLETAVRELLRQIDSSGK